MIARVGAASEGTDERDARGGQAREPEPTDRAAADGSAAAAAPADAQPLAQAERGGQPVAEGERVKASPLARRIARESGIDLHGVSGSGPGGRIVKADVLAGATGGGGATGSAGTAAESAPADAADAGASIPAPPPVPRERWRA